MTNNINNTVTAYVRLLESIKDTKEKLRHMQIEKEYFTAAIADYMQSHSEQHLKFNDQLSLTVKSKPVRKTIKPKKEDVLLASGIDKTLAQKILTDLKGVSTTEPVHKNYICLHKKPA
ncbi:hypothetical protein [Scale drop disease virus]|uniref:ORF_010R n=1 Tax=Scale drop disease virus TaxID=1697349 RepID=A0A0K1L723_9VIRU|nr:ORF_010R [Scale drop disease virus]AKU37425.1 ORF_010R [Scale drop disease virus]QLI60680.1 hypothetical protein [Scale drop disease virus]QXJ13598.1 ORF010R [Scale drop disease virus]UNH60775.1 hypothetical protein SDDV_ORF106 [Scale drop disease virus]